MTHVSSSSYDTHSEEYDGVSCSLSQKRINILFSVPAYDSRCSYIDKNIKNIDKNICIYYNIYIYIKSLYLLLL
jgi:hypothetical protein